MHKSMAAVLAVCAAVGCAHVGADAEDDFETPPGCSGVPGDFRTPDAARRADPPTHGPGTLATPARIKLRREAVRWKELPPLYVFDPDGARVYSLSGHDPTRDDIPLEWLRQAPFDRAEAVSYWGEVVDNQFYLVPEFDTCELIAALDQPLGTSAPPRGLLFLQYVSRDCRSCDELSRAIEQVIGAHPDRPFRWVQIESPVPVSSR
ncbi:hypothetical protein [Pseudomonas sp. CGJS7]|uniref:hypothetical protein n=1 Tax=Pseudomonas sp. CGJS7 TaxID=3109348 RepID=UPI00300BE889